MRNDPQTKPLSSLGEASECVLFFLDCTGLGGGNDAVIRLLLYCCWPATANCLAQTSDVRRLLLLLLLPLLGRREIGAPLHTTMFGCFCVSFCCTVP